MIRVTRPDFDGPEWIEWRQEASRALQDLKNHYTSGAENAVNEVLYKKAMPFLLKLFHGKCAYCETLISNNQPGDVEHYRPKGRVRELDGRIVKVVFRGREMDHPGYWWLCYEWANLLPSCADCNRRRRHGEDRVALGKAEIFPIAGRRACTPEESLTAEEALLLDPTGQDPAQHFEFQPDGKMAPKTPAGQTSCDLLGLNLRERLPEERANAYSSALAEVGQFINVSTAALVFGGGMTEQEKQLRRRINDMWEGRTPYSAFVRLALDFARQRLAERAISFTLPLPIQ